MEKQLKDTLNFIIENSTNDNIRKSNILSIVDEYITYKKNKQLVINAIKKEI